MWKKLRRTTSFCFFLNLSNAVFLLVVLWKKADFAFDEWYPETSFSAHLAALHEPHRQPLEALSSVLLCGSIHQQSLSLSFSITHFLGYHLGRTNSKQYNNPCRIEHKKTKDKAFYLVWSYLLAASGLCRVLPPTRWRQWDTLTVCWSTEQQDGWRGWTLQG